LKEIERSVICGLYFLLPESLVDDLITYCVSRLNIRSTASLMGHESPRVRLTGRPVDYKLEFKLSSGDYVEARNPEVTQNDIRSPRSDPCIALFPTSGINGAWKMLNLKTKRKVLRSVYKNIPTTPDVIVRIMNEMAGARPVTFEMMEDRYIGNEDNDPIPSLT